MGIKAYYAASVAEFLLQDDESILGKLTLGFDYSLREQQRWAWTRQIPVLRSALAAEKDGFIFLELFIPRMGKRADVVILIKDLVLVLEFKVGQGGHLTSALDQVEDYALDLKNFHEGSHSVPIVPILISTEAVSLPLPPVIFAQDRVASPVACNALDLARFINHICQSGSWPALDLSHWINKGYKPTPTIIEAAQVLFARHSVADISRSDSGAKNLAETSAAVDAVIDRSRRESTKSICFVTGVPGSGKTLAGLSLATRRLDEHRHEHAVFLSGNGPLVDVLRESLARDKARREGTSKSRAEREVRSFIQNIHHFRDEYIPEEKIPIERVVVFDEAQRAWTRTQAAGFMQRKRGLTSFDMSEPEFLIGVMDRHPEWCTVICLVGGGQEINTGEAGISEWIAALETRFPSWQVYVSPRIACEEYTHGLDAERFFSSSRVHAIEDLHLAVSMRSFRAEGLSNCVGHVIDNQPSAAGQAYKTISHVYPIHLTRDLARARQWLREKARGTERYGLVASSGAQRLRPDGIHVKADLEPSNWFLNDKEDVRSSFFLEDVATEFAVQGLELDWTGVCWDGDFHHQDGKWAHQIFKGTKWLSVKDAAKRLYLRNAYRVLLTRARQGMVIFVPTGSATDRTRDPRFYDQTFDYLQSCGFTSLD